MDDGAPPADGPAKRIENAVAGLLEQLYGKRPEAAKAYLDDDLVVVVLRDEFTRVEETLLDAGHGDAVIEQRAAVRRLMRERFSAIVEAETGREVLAFMSGRHHEPALQAELFVLAPSNGTVPSRASRE